MDFAKEATFLDQLADAASDSIMPHFRARLAVENKAEGTFDPVTVADRAAEAAMRKLINETFPDHGIIGEEYGSERAEADFVWVLDPIDGTRAFITGLPSWGTLIGLLWQGKPVLGLMAQAFTGERYAGDGARAWYRGPGGPSDLAARPCPALAEAALMTTSPRIFSATDQAAYDRVERAVRLPRYGFDCYAYCMVAAGHADLVIESGLKPYDIVALIPIIEGAGGRVTNWEGQSAAGGGRILAVGAPGLHGPAMELLAGR
jgi:myo-inositol-1(or 4)-monophosphatase